jgi:hypothetical protein
MVANGFRQRRLKIEEPLVERRRILAVQGDHLRPRLTTPDDLEGLLFDGNRDGPPLWGDCT